MEVVYERCCGLDIHKQTVVACVILPGAPGKPRKAIRTFGTMTADLLQLADWLTQQEVTHVAMESTGVYWKPVWNLLESNFTMLLVNAQHVKTVRPCRGARPMCATANGSRNCFGMGCSRPVSCPTVRSASCGS